MNAEIGLDGSVNRGEGAITNDMDGGKARLSIKRGGFFGMDEMDGRTWKLMALPQPVRRIVSQLLGEYEVEAETCPKGRLLMHWLAENGIIHLD